MKASLILLAGGKGVRMGREIPKQFIKVGGNPIAQYALEPFLNHPLIDQIVIVCDSSYQDQFEADKIVEFAEPGSERQFSLLNGLSKIKDDRAMVIVHDAARPHMESIYIEPLIKAAHQHGASILGVRSTSTLKLSTDDQFVNKTLDRSSIWEIQTPQLAPKNVLLKGLKKAQNENLLATDEASLVELLGQDVKIVEGNSLNFKVTTQADLKLTESLLKRAEYV